MPQKSGTTSKSVPEDRLSRLRWLAARLVREIESADSSAAVASLSRSLVTVLEQIDELAPSDQAKGTPLDELAKRRAARPAGPAGRAGAAR